MTLPADVARCPGSWADGDMREGCGDCQRRTDPPHARQVWMSPRMQVLYFMNKPPATGECDARIAPEKP